MNTKDKTQNSIRNSAFGIASQIVIILISFFTRSIFLKYLSEEYLGLNGLFSNVISILSLTELGFGTAAIYALYKPLAAKEEEQVAALMNLYAKIYHIMFAIVTILGLILLPFIRYIIKDLPEDIPNIHLIYLLFVLNSALSYLFAYKRSLLFADQKNFKISVVTTVFKLLLAMSQIVGLMLTSNYYVYLGAMIVCGVLENLVISTIVDRNYPYLRKYRKAKASPEVKQGRKDNTKSLIVHKIGTIAVYQTDNLIISAFINLATTGLYSNYTMITNSLQQLTNSLVEGMKASIGIYNASETPARRIILFKKFNLLLHLINSFCTTCLLCLFNPFIEFAFGEEYLFAMPLVLLICLEFYVRGMRVSFNTVKETCGIFRPDRYKPLFEAAGNLTLSILFVKWIGFAGIMLSTILTTLCICYTIEVYVTCKYAFACKPGFYYQLFAKNILVLAVQLAATYGLCSLLPMYGFGALALKACVCLAMPNLINLAAYWRDPDLHALLGTAKRFLKKRLPSRK